MLPVLILASSMSACAPDAFNLNPCPPVVAYRQEVQIQAADELQALPPDAVLRRMMSDYAVMREQARLCR